MSSNLIFCCPLLLLPSVFPSRVFSNESALHIRWSNYWSFNISHFSEYSGISLRIDWFDLLADQEDLKESHITYPVVILYIGFVAAAAAKLLQSCPTLCNPRDGSPPGSSVSGILQARTLEWVGISFSNIGFNSV